MQLTDAHIMARSLMDKHGLQNWGFQFDGAKKTFGVTWYKRKIISLSKTLTELNEESHVRDTILHEIAHALVPRGGHSREWRRKAIEIGCNGKRQYSSEVIIPKLNWIAICEDCKRTYQRVKTPKMNRRYWCRCNNFDRKNLMWVKQTIIL